MPRYNFRVITVRMYLLSQTARADGSGTNVGSWLRQSLVSGTVRPTDYHTRTVACSRPGRIPTVRLIPHARLSPTLLIRIPVGDSIAIGAIPSIDRRRFVRHRRPWLRRMSRCSANHLSSILILMRVITVVLLDFQCTLLCLRLQRRVVPNVVRTAE